MARFGARLERTHPTVAREYDELEALPNSHSALVKALRRNHVVLLDQVRAAIRRRGFSVTTQQTYLHWILGFLSAANPRENGAPEIGRFLDSLAVHRRVSGRTQNLALDAGVFL